MHCSMDSHELRSSPHFKESIMTKRNLTLLGAALAGAMLAASAGANDINPPMPRAGDRATTSASPGIPGTRAVEGTVVRDTTPASPSESRSLPIREPQDPIARGDNPNLPNPVTPSGANESAPQPRTTVYDPTNQPGITPPARGATR
jgi:hypothetical protein